MTWKAFPVLEQRSFEILFLLLLGVNIATSENFK